MHSFPDVKFRTPWRGLVAALGLAVALPFVRAQKGVGNVGAAAPAAVSFASMAQSVRVQDYTIVELRRFFTTNGVIAVREEVRVDANGTAHPDFELDYRGVEGEPTGSVVWQQWSQTYAEHSRLLFEHGMFRILDLARARANYTLHDYGPAQRLGRAVRRCVVFPQRPDKPIWFVEVDVATKVPLYGAEYDSHMRMLSEIEAVSFVGSAQLGAQAGSTTLTVHPSFTAARTFMGAPGGLVEPKPTATDEYEMHRVEVRTDPLNNRQTLLLGYTDGVDQFFVVETPGTSDSFGALPVRQKTGPSHTIARYRDPAMSVLLFWDESVSFQVAGRGSLLRLDGFAQAIYVQALQTSSR